MTTGLIIKPFSVWVNGYPSAIYYAKSRGQATAKAWREYTESRDLSFIDFCKIASVKLADRPEHFGTPIMVGGKPAFFIESNRQYVRFVRPDSDVIISAHPYDVEPEHMRPDTYRKVESQ